MGKIISSVLSTAFFILYDCIYDKVLKIMIKETHINIPDKEYSIIKNYKSMLLFEQETGKSITDLRQNLTDLVMLFYCIVKANNQVEFTFEQFVSMIDERPEAMDEFNGYLIDSATLVTEPPIKKKKVNHLK